MTFQPIKPTAFIRRLMIAQGQNCFHCDTPMALILAPNECRKNAVTREHVFPHSSTGKGVVNNIVLAHSRCNGKRGDQNPSAAEIAKAARIYKAMRLVPFVPAEQSGIDFSKNKRSAERRI